MRPNYISQSFCPTYSASRRGVGDLKDKGKEKGEADADGEKPAKQEDRDDITSESDPTASLQNLQPNIPKDYELFLNLVEFCKVVLLLESANTKDGDSGPTPAVKTEPDIDQAAVKEEDGAEKDGIRSASLPSRPLC